jgi:tetratricopeptide (TPR) repeat protein/tRNA A-37 threonylcarbamoyl transferase component Bud32
MLCDNPPRASREQNCPAGGVWSRNVSAGAGNVADDSPETTGIALIRGGMIGRYIVLGLLGKGGMGVVYSAYDPELDRKVALKLLRIVNRKKGEDLDAKRMRLLREAKAIARLSHPSVVVVYDVGTFQDQVFIAMELVDGMTALRWRDTRKPSWREILRVFIDAGEGIAAAHAADLIHRDFKPDNVMVTREGKVRVMDFGLARTMERITAETAPISNDSTDGPTMPGVRPAEPRLTNEGNVVGTPAYMPPEQYLGVTDERSDQFSFCVSLYECIYGQHPFEARTSVGLTGNMQAGRVHDAPSGTRVPLWVRKILLKGLRPRPEDRFASMREVLAALGKDPAVARRRWLIAGGAIAAAGALVFGMQRAADSRRAFCAAAPEKLAAAWELPRRGEAEGPRHADVRRAFLATGKPYAQDAVRGVLKLLDDYAAKWAGLYRDACEATHVRGEQSEEVLDLRMGCLNDRLAGMRALTDIFATATGEVVEHGVEAAHALTPVDSCSDIKQLKSLIPPPDPGVKQRVEALRRELGQIKAIHDAGRYVNALDRLKPLVDESKTLGYRPLDAEVSTLMGATNVQLGRNADAEKFLDDALRAALASHHDDLLPEISANLVWVVGFQGRFEDAQRWSRFADATIERETMLNPIKYSWVLNDMGAVYYLEQRYAEALEYQERARQIKEKVLGPDDPDVAVTVSNIALALNKLGRAAEALRMSDRSLRIHQRALGDSHPAMGDELSNRGEILLALNRPTEALDAYQRAKKIWELELGSDSPAVAYALTGIGRALVAAKQPREARPVLERALSIRERNDPEPSRLAETELWLASALWDGGRDFERAVTLAQRALGRCGQLPALSSMKTEIGKWLTTHRLSTRTLAEGHHATGQ